MRQRNKRADREVVKSGDNSHPQSVREIKRKGSLSLSLGGGAILKPSRVHK
jgi:hypothetical protein